MSASVMLPMVWPGYAMRYVVVMFVSPMPVAQCVEFGVRLDWCPLPCSAVMVFGLN